MSRLVPIILSILLLAAPAPAQRPTIFVRTGAARGPTLLVVAGIHGNEPAPPLAARALVTSEIDRGRLVIVPEANRAALAKKSRHTPGARFLDLNRNFPIPGRRSARGRLASELWRLVERERPDFVVDVHEGFDFNRRNAKSVGSSVTYVPHARGGAEAARLGRHLVRTVNETIDDPSRHFTLIAPGPEGSFARSVAEELGIPSLVLETTRVRQPLELRVAQHHLLLAEIVARLGLRAEASPLGR
jgi:predicted deacylase